MKWIQFRGHQSYHAVFVELDGRSLTYCDRSVGPIQIRWATDKQPENSLCTSCVRRIAKPALVPAHMRELLRTRNTAPALQRHIELHAAFDELLACYLLHNRGKLPSTTTVTELMSWSHEQTKGAIDA